MPALLGRRLTKVPAGARVWKFPRRCWRNCRRIHGTKPVSAAIASWNFIAQKMPTVRSPKILPGDFYFDSGWMVFTAEYHLRRGYCCGNGCRHCPIREKTQSRSVTA
jgi:hypothetical protein